MPRLSNSVPKYRKHKASGQAVVTIGGKDIYLGPHGTKASKIEYDRHIGEWLAAGRPSQSTPLAEITVVEVCNRYRQYAESYHGREENYHIRTAIRALKSRYGRTPANEFGPLALKALQNWFVEEGVTRVGVNARIQRIRRIFKWAASEEQIPPTVPQGLATVQPLRKGKTKAPETSPVLPVDDEVVDATLPHLPPIVADMVRFQRLTGARPTEVCILRPCDVDRSGEVWIYRPESHKTEHHGKSRIILIGPQGQDVLRPYLLRSDDAYCFSPAESEQKRRKINHAARKTPLSCGNVPGSNKKRKPKRKPRDRYSQASYRRAVHRACEKAEIGKWSPNQLRHAAATTIRKKFGLESAQVVLGHSM